MKFPVLYKQHFHELPKHFQSWDVQNSLSMVNIKENSKEKKKQDK